MKHFPSRLLAAALVTASPLLLGGCAVVTVAGAAAGAAITVTGAVVSTGITVAGSVASAGISAAGKVVEKTADVAAP